MYNIVITFQEEIMQMETFSEFKMPSNFAMDNLFYSDGMGYLKSKDFYINRKSFRNNLFMYVLSGTLSVEQNGKHTIKKGEMVVLRLSEKHNYYSDPHDVCEVLWLHFADKNSPLLLNYIEGEVTLPYVAEIDAIKIMIEKCMDVARKGYPDREYKISEAIYHGLLSICKYINNHKIYNETSERGKFIQKVNHFTEQHIYEKIDLEEFAKVCEVSKYHFCKLFKYYLDITPIQYFTKMKIERSKGRLTYSTESISSIALSFGFNDPSHYSKTFKKYVGMSPKMYRERGL